MARHLRIFFFLSVIIDLCACNYNGARQIPVTDFFKAAEQSNFRISPDGRYISYLKPYKEKQNLVIRSLADGTERMVTSFSDYSVRGDYFWTFNDKIVFSQDIIALDELKLFTLNVADMSVHNILTQEKVRITLLNRNRQQPDMITIRMNKRDPANFDIYRMDVKSGELTPYLINPGNITEWYPDPDGKIRLVTSSDGVNKTILYRPNDNTPFKPIIQSNFKTFVRPIAFTGEKNYFYALSNINRDKMALVEINAEDGKEKRVIFACVNADIQDCDYSKNKHQIELVS